MAVEIFKLVGSIFVDNDKANESISKTDEKAGGLSDKFLKGVGTAAKWGAGIAAAAGAGAAALYGMATKSAEATDRIDKLSQKVGLSRQAFQEMDFACSQSGMSVESLQGGMKTLTQQIDKGADGFDKLGVSLTNSDGSLRSQEDVMFDTMSALQGMENQTEKARLASELFGKSGTELMPMLNGASGSIDEMRQKAHDLGLVLDDNAINSGVAFTDMVDQIKRSFGAVATQVGVEVMPILVKFGQYILDNMPTIQDAVSTAFAVIQDVVSVAGQIIGDAITFVVDNLNIIIPVLAGAVAGFVAFNVISTIVPLFTALQAAIAATTTVQELLNVVMAANPFGLVVTAIGLLVAAGVALYMNWDTVKLKCEELFAKISEIWNNIKTTISTKIDEINKYLNDKVDSFVDAGKAIFTGVWDGMKEVWTDITGWIANRAEEIADALTFWKKSKSEMDDDSDDEADGSLAGGLDRVPFDGYRAILHKEEAVLTADEAKEHRKGKNKGTGDFIINIAKVENKGDGTMTRLLQEAEFYRKQKGLATGGAF